MLYACASGADAFTSKAADCEGQTKIGDAGLVFTKQPNNIPTVPLYRCNGGADHFESRDATCGGKTVEDMLGYTVGYAVLARYNSPGFDHVTTTDGVPAAFVNEGWQGYVSLVSGDGLQPLMLCRNGVDSFDSNDAACEGKTVVSSLGYVMAQAPADAAAGKQLTRCTLPPADSMVSLEAACEGVTVDKPLGYARATAPTGGEFETES
jgi:hypothetical protein